MTKDEFAQELLLRILVQKTSNLNLNELDDSFRQSIARMAGYAVKIADAAYTRLDGAKRWPNE